jgi:type IV pilus assembly protein PilC
MFNIPVLGTLNSEVAMTIMTRTLGTLINSGVSILDSLRIVAKAMGNDKYRLALEISAKTVEKGLPFSSAIKRDPEFAPIVSQLLAIGEETGTLGESLLRLSKYYQESSERLVKGLTTALEPLMILLMGAMVGGLAIAVLLPMFNLVNVIK